MKGVSQTFINAAYHRHSMLMQSTLFENVLASMCTCTVFNCCLYKLFQFKVGRLQIIIVAKKYICVVTVHQ